MNINPNQVIRAGIYCGGLYAVWRLCLTVFYPAVYGALWQRMIGPWLTQRWPNFAQREDQARPSYLPSKPDDPNVIVWGLFPPPLDDVTNGIRDGLLLGLLCALLPDLGLAMLFTALLAFVLVKHIWRLALAEGAVAIDRLYWAGREVLMYCGIIVALRSTDFLH